MQLQPLVQGQDAFQRIKTVIDLKKPQAGTEYFDLDGQKVEVAPTDKFNLVIDSANGLAARVIYGKVVLEAGEDRALPFGMDRAELEGTFGEKSTGNILVDSRGSKSDSNDSVAILSKNTVFDETSAGSVAFKSDNSRFIDGMNDRAVNSPNTGFFLSHNNRVKSSPGKEGDIDHVNLDRLYMEESDGKGIREAMLSDPRTLIVNIDDAKFVASPGAKALSSEYIQILRSPNAYAELASGGVTVRDSEGVHLENVNSTRKVKVVVEGSPSLKAKNSTGIRVSGSPGANLSDAHFAHVRDSAGLKIVRSLNVTAFGSGNSSVRKSDGAILKDSPNSVHSTSLESRSEDSPGSRITNGDENVILRSPNASITDSFGATIKDSEGAGAYDAQGVKISRSPGLRAEVVQESKITGLAGKEIVNKPFQVFTAKDAKSFPDAKQSYKVRPGV